MKDFTYSDGSYEAFSRAQAKAEDAAATYFNETVISLCDSIKADCGLPHLFAKDDEGLSETVMSAVASCQEVIYTHRAEAMILGYRDESWSQYEPVPMDELCEQFEVTSFKDSCLIETLACEILLQEVNTELRRQMESLRPTHFIGREPDLRVPSDDDIADAEEGDLSLGEERHHETDPAIECGEATPGPCYLPDSDEK